MPTISQQLSVLVEQKNKLVENLVSKGISASPNEKLNTLVPKVLQINTSEGGLDTSDANAVSSDLANSKTAYVKGQKITGTLQEYSEPCEQNAKSVSMKGGVLYLEAHPTVNSAEFIAREGYSKNLIGQPDIVASAIGLTSNKIKSGETILNVQGTYKADKVIQSEDAELEQIGQITGNNDLGLSVISSPLTQSKLYELGSMVEMHPTFEQLADILNISPDKIKSGEIISGVDGTFTSDATATSNDIVKGKTAYVNGVKVTGTLEKTESCIREVDLLNTKGFNSVSETLSEYGDIVLISEDSGQSFLTLNEIYNKYSEGNPVDNFVSSNSVREYGIMTDTWVGKKTPISVLFKLPVTFTSSKFIIDFYGSLNNWVNITITTQLYKCEGETENEKLSNVMNKIANEEECQLAFETVYSGNNDKIDVYKENRALTPETQIDAGEYYVYLTGFTNNNNSNMTLINVRTILM